MAQPWHRGPWQQIRQTILTRDHHTCQIRGTHCTLQATHVDHITSPLEGGAWYDPTNLRATCQQCNLRRPRTPRQHRGQRHRGNHPTTPRPTLNTTETPSRNW